MVQGTGVRTGVRVEGTVKEVEGTATMTEGQVKVERGCTFGLDLGLSLG